MPDVMLSKHIIMSLMCGPDPLKLYSYELHHQYNNSNDVLHLQSVRLRLVRRGRGPGQSKQRCVSNLTVLSLLLQS